MSLAAFRRARLWPRELMRQVLLVATIVILASGVASSLVAEHRIGALSRASLEHEAAALAHSVASGGAVHLVTGDAAALESLLLASAALPGVRAIAVTDRTGRVAAAVRRDESGVPRADYTLRDLAPLPADASVGVSGAGDAAVIAAWQPVRNGLLIGWVRAELGMEAQRAASTNARQDALVSAAVVSLLTLAALYHFFGRALRPLQRYARFAGRLGTRLGATMPVARDSAEVEELGNALNFASHELETRMVALARSESRIQALLDTAADAIIGLESDGRITFANAACRHVFGLDPAKVAGRPMKALLPEVDEARLAELRDQGVMVGGASGRVERFDTEGMRNGGVAFPADVTLGLAQSPEGAHITCIVRDCAERKMIDDHLRLFSRALECTANGVVIVDLALPGQPVIYANAAFERITGYSADEVIGRNCRLLQRDDTDQASVEALRAAVRDGRATTVTLRNYRKDGTPFWNELSIAPVRSSSGTITHFVGVQSDVTTARRATQALAEHSARIDTVFEMSPEGFVLFERPGRLVAVNRAFLQMTGLGMEQLDGCTIEAFDRLVASRCDPREYCSGVGAFDDPPGAAGTAAGATTLITLMRPERRILERHARFSRESRELILYYRDITRESEVDRMKSEFLSTAAHELRTPMVSIFGFSELLLKRRYTEERQREFLETIHRQTGRLVNLVNELLDLARIEARAGKDFKIESQPLAPIVRDAAAALCMPGDARNAEIVFPAELPWATIDQDKFRLAFTNVLSNAFKYSPAGGVVRVRAVERLEKGRPMLGIVVEDQGIGMSPEHLARAFERFFRADASGNIPGTGLGLCVVKEVMELQGGTVELASELGEGTRVTLWIPAAPAREPIAA